MEEWKQVTNPGCENYEVSSLSRVRNSRGRIRKPSVTGKITLSGVNTHVQILSCLAFHGPRPSKEHTVDHINRDWKNHNINNLRWASKSDQSKNKKSYTKKGYCVIYKTPNGKILYNSISDAERNLGMKKWTLHPKLKKEKIVKVKGGTIEYDKLMPKRDSLVKTVPSWIFEDNECGNVKVSTCGLVMGIYGWTTGFFVGRPSKYFSIGIKGKHYMVHRLIAAAFLGEPEDPRQIFVNHKDGYGFNNAVENIEWVTNSENSRHAVETGLRGDLSPVVQYNLNGIRIKEFNSIADAVIELKSDSNRTGIGQVCMGKLKSAYNYMWRYKYEAPDKLNPIRSNEVRQYDLNGNIMNIFLSGIKAAKALGVGKKTIYRWCGDKNTTRGFTLERD